MAREPFYTGHAHGGGTNPEQLFAVGYVELTANGQPVST
jgi:hypothetical protein